MDLLDRRASSNELQDHFGNVPRALHISEDLWRQLIGEIIAVHTSPLEWLEPKHQRWVKERAAGALSFLLTRFRPLGLLQTEELLEPSIAWIAQQNDATVARFCWQLVVYPGSDLSALCALYHRDRLHGHLSLEYIELAAAIHNEANAMFQWRDERWSLVRWQRDSEVYLQCLDHASCLVRAAAAEALGHLYYGCAPANHAGIPPLAEILHEIGRRERATPGIAGPFLCGCQFKNGPSELPWPDLRTWMLETLRKSTLEPETPSALTLSFYAHEFFAADGPAIEEFLAMGRDGLAVYTATQDPESIEAIRDVLERMARSDNPEVAQAIQTYLAHPSHHNGAQFFTGPAFGLTNYS